MRQTLWKRMYSIYYVQQRAVGGSYYSKHVSIVCLTQPRPRKRLDSRWTHVSFKSELSQPTYPWNYPKELCTAPVGLSRV